MNNSMQFTDDERARLLAVWKRPSEKKIEVIKSFIDSAEFILSDVLNNDFLPIPDWSTKEANRARSEIAAHARALRLALGRLPERELWRLGTVSGITMQVWRMPEPTKRYVPVLSNFFIPITLRQLEIIEAVIKEEDKSPGRKPQPGPNKTLESQIIKRLIFAYSPKTLKVSTSRNGNFYIFLKELGEITGLQFGHDLLKSVNGKEKRGGM